MAYSVRFSDSVTPPAATHVVAGYLAAVTRLPLQDGGGYIAIVPSLPGCMSDGETEDEACIAVRDAVAQWIDAAKQAGRLIPPPDAV